MKTRNLITTLLLAATAYGASGQAIDNTTSYKNINLDRYFRITYENDFFSATDEYYTQGINLELVSPAMKKNPLAYALIRPNFGYVRYGLGFQHNGYTPSTVSYNEIQYGDRPFAGTMFLQTFMIAIDSAKKQRFTSSLSTGVIGPLAGAGQMQRSIHKWLNNYTPHGWDNQIQNDLILNYQVDYEKQLIGLGKVFSLAANGSARVGTLSDKAGVGVTMMIGYFESPYSSAKAGKNDFRIYAYEHPEFSFIGYDATLQGGVFDHDSPYTIKAGDINRVTFQNRFGFVAQYQRIYLEYFLAVSSREFEQQKMHTWGGIQVAFGL